MTLEVFREVIRKRIPTAEEFLAVVKGQGWFVHLRDEKHAVLKVRDPSDPLAQALAKMLGREPYRTRVLEAVRAARWAC